MNELKKVNKMTVFIICDSESRVFLMTMKKKGDCYWRRDYINRKEEGIKCKFKRRWEAEIEMKGKESRKNGDSNELGRCVIKKKKI